MPLLPPPPAKSSASTAPNGGAGVGVVGAKKDAEIVVIPEKFYGAALKQKVTDVPAEPPRPPKPVAPPPPVALPPAVPSHPGWKIAIGVIVFVLAIGGGFVYFNRQTLFKKPVPPPPPPPPITTPSAPANLAATFSGNSVALAWADTSGNENGYRIERKEEGGTFLPLTNLSANSTVFLDGSVQAGKNYAYRVVAVNESGEAASNEASAATQPAAPPPPAAPMLPPSGLDSDSDGLSDVEEGVSGTDRHHPDSDGDGFLDGNEVFHLYNPAAKAPTRLLDSGVAQTWNAPSGWSVLIPVKWSASLNLPDGSKATLDTKHGERFLISIDENPQRLPLVEWYLAGHPGIVSTSLKTVMTKGGLEGILGADRMNAYFAWGDRVFSLQYDMNGQSYINFRTTFEMMLNSLKLSGAPILSVAPAETLAGPGALLAGESATTTVAATSSPSAP